MYSREQLANEANFRLIFYLLIPAGRKLFLKSKQYAGLKNVFSRIFAISLCIPSQIDARQPAIPWLSLEDILCQFSCRIMFISLQALMGFIPEFYMKREASL